MTGKGGGVNLPLVYVAPEYELVEVNLPLTLNLILGVNVPPKTKCFCVTDIGGQFTPSLQLHNKPPKPWISS